MRILKLLCRALAVAVMIVLAVVSPVFAISNPDAIAFYCVGSTPVVKVFYNVLQTGDMLFTAEQYVHYVVTPNETASQAFMFEVLNTAGNETIASTPLKQYEAKPISIYMTANQVSTAGISVGEALILRIMGNPLMFASPTGNSVNVTLGASNYIDQLLGEDGGVATSNNLRNFLIEMADDIETFDSPPAGSEYIVTVSGVRYLSTEGSSLFLEGIPGLDAMCPIIFQYGSSPMTGDTPESTGAYQSALSPLAKWGETTSNGLTNLGIYLGINQAMAGSVLLLVLVGALAIYAYAKTQSGISVLLLIGAAPFIGAWMGLMPLALAFVFAIAIVVMLGYFFFSRGAL